MRPVTYPQAAAGYTDRHGRTFLPLSLLALVSGLFAPALPCLGDSSGWKADSQHPEFQYRVKCRQEVATIEWRNGYPGEVTLSASIKSDSYGGTYDGSENVTVAPHASAETTMETMACVPDGFRIRFTRFLMAPPPTPPAPPAAAAPEKSAPQVPLVAKYEPPVDDLPAIGPEALASIKLGMQEDGVVRKLGPPISKLTVPEPGEFIETCQYRLTTGRSVLIRFVNGVLAEVKTR